MKVLCAHPSRRRAFTLLEALVVLASTGILAAILVPVVLRSHHDNGQIPYCLSNLKQIRIALMHYQQDADGRFPIVVSNSVSRSVAPFPRPYGWADAIQPYIRSTAVYRCPTVADSLPHSDDATQSGFTDYWINTNVAGRTEKDIGNVWLTLLCGEGNDGSDGADARYNRNVLPQQWLDAEGSPSMRHRERASYLFVDGQIKLLKPNDIEAGRLKNGKATFSIR